MRDNMGIAVVCMVNTTSYSTSTPSNIQQVDDDLINDPLIVSEKAELPKCKKWSIYSQNSTETQHSMGAFEWNATMQSWLFSAVFYGSFITVMFSGYFADRYGPRLLIVIGISTYIVLSFLGPTLAEFDFYALIVARVIMGIAEGCIQPSVAAMIPRWFPQNERSTVAAIYTSGFQLGNGFIALVGAKLCLVHILNGWPLIFYMSGCFGILCLLIWCCMASNTPAENRFISEKEQNYLFHQLQETKPSILVEKETKKFQVPWLKMMTSSATISVLISGFALEFQFAIIQSFLPSYLRDILALDMDTNGLFAAVPFVSHLITKNILSIIADKLKKSGRVNMTTSCKVLQAYAAFGTSAVTLCLALFVDCTRPELALILLILFGFCFAGFVPGIYTALLSIAPAFTGTLTSLYTFVGMSAKIITPTVVGFINKTGSQYEWALIFMVASGLNIFAGVFFLFFGSAETQKWNDSSNDEEISGKSSPETNL
uniref:Major facilitator superfamily (MFS) profile domain-containing protein n=1 Tax=Acrobeloides nanus TaxID=290746 RepID=A0A914DRM3_9BILA